MGFRKLIWTALFVCGVFSGLIGCTPIERYRPTPKPMWRVELVRPDGVTQRTWFVASCSEPKVHPQSSGHTLLVRDTGGLLPESTGLVAPTGWAFFCYPHESDSKKQENQ